MSINYKPYLNNDLYRSVKRNISSFLFVVPALIIFTLIVYYPLIRSFEYSFTDWNMRSPEYNFVGFSNYVKIFSDKLVMAGIKNTLVFTLYTTFIGNFLALILALTLDRNLKTKKILRVAFYLPCLLSPVVISAIFSDILQFNGLLNEIFRTLRFEFLVNDWFANEATALPMIIVLNAWQWAGYGSVIYLAGLQTIPEELYESAKIDGAKSFYIFRYITFPMIMPSITIMTFLSITGGLKYFDIPFILTNGGPGTSTETMATVIYRIAFFYEQFGYATAMSVMFFLIIIIFSVIQVSYTRKREIQL